MRKFALFLAVALALSSTHAEAALVEKMNSNKALAKFSRGVTNVLSFPGEVITQMPTAMDQSPDYLTGFVATLGRGLGYGLLRAGSGIYDIATCPFPGPTDYKPIMKPATIFEKAADATTSVTID